MNATDRALLELVPHPGDQASWPDLFRWAGERGLSDAMLVNAVFRLQWDRGILVSTASEGILRIC